MLLMLFFIGFFATVLAGAPPGAANVAVISSKLSNNNTISKLMVGASIGEVLLAFLALQYTMQLASFFAQNPWVQITVFSIFITIGIVLLFPLKQLFTLPKVKVKPPIKTPFLKGLFLAFINPPVLLFWVLAFGSFTYFGFEISNMSGAFELLLFFSGVLLGKLSVLALYAALGKKQKKKKGATSALYRGIGIAFVLLGIAQAIRFVFI